MSMSRNNFKMMTACWMLLAGIFTLASCSDDNNGGPKMHTLTVNVALPDGMAADNIDHLKVIATNSKGNRDTLELTAGESKELQLLQGQYQLIASGKVADEAAAYVSGKKDVELYGDMTATVQLEKIIQSPLVFKAIYTTGGKAGYVMDSYFEIVNNSDEVQYLDGLILSSPQGGQSSANAWQANGYTDIYENGQGTVVAFPGSGTEHPLLPGQSVVVANDAANHSELAPEDNNCPDLSQAQWEIYIDNVKGEIDYPAANLDVIFQNNAYMKAFGLGFFGRAYVLARCPEGVTPQDFASDPANIMTTPGTTSTMQYLMIPSKYVLDAVDIWDATAEVHYGTFLPKDDAQGVLASSAWSGKCVRRKVTRIEGGRAYYQDTNNSNQDFLNNQPLTPGQPPTQAD